MKQREHFLRTLSIGHLKMELHTPTMAPEMPIEIGRWNGRSCFDNEVPYGTRFYRLTQTRSTTISLDFGTIEYWAQRAWYGTPAWAKETAVGLGYAAGFQGEKASGGGSGGCY